MPYRVVFDDEAKLMAKICTRFKSCLPFCAHCRCHNLLKAEKRKETRVDHATAATAAGCCCWSRRCAQVSLLRDETRRARAEQLQQPEQRVRYPSDPRPRSINTRHTLYPAVLYTPCIIEGTSTVGHINVVVVYCCCCCRPTVVSSKRKKKHTQHAIVVWARS